VAPDEAAFRADVAKAAFRAGVADRRWRLHGILWPHALIGVFAKEQREYVIQFEGSGFPNSLPTGRLWDLARGAPLAFDLWPRHHGGRVGAVFRPDWKGGSALYLPCDRLSIPGHDQWRNQMPSKIWRPAAGIVQYLELVHELLHCRDYAPPVRAAA
jgi:hypothetical protein